MSFTHKKIKPGTLLHLVKMDVCGTVLGPDDILMPPNNFEFVVWRVLWHDTQVIENNTEDFILRTCIIYNAEDENEKM